MKLHVQHFLSAVNYLRLIAPMFLYKLFQISNADQCEIEVRYGYCLACTKKYQQTIMPWLPFSQNRC